MKIVTLTMNPAIDLNTQVRQVVPEKKLRCEPPRREPGGGGINVSRAIRRLGGDSMAVYLAGGPTGEILERLLEEEGVRQRQGSVREWTRENLLVLEETSGQQFRFGMPGPEVSEEEWKYCLNELERLDPVPEYIVASGSLAPGMPEDFYGRVAQAAADRGTRVVVDTSGEALRSVAGAGVFLLKPNLGELRELVGKDLVDEAEQIAAAQKLIADGCCHVVVISLGAGGALAVTADRGERVRTPTVPIRSKVGAGDSMVAGIVLGLARGMETMDAVRLGVAAGAAAVMTEGTELCRRDDTERLFAELKADGRAPLPAGG
jgi:6-phosphofructokinase 2